MQEKAAKLSAAAKREQNWGWFMVAPTIIGLVVLNVYPFIQTLIMSFSKHLGFGTYEFIGLKNYADMFQSPEFWKATWNTIYFCILTVP
ncbi:MAG: sugar ABC transporter permease, partial [Eubacteriales bacterium]|nr:sugar ABC transporter permease [Eubacteriales bacterium]